MRTRNMRVAITGAALILLACGFFLGMGTIAPRSTDPRELMRIVGMVSGVGGGLGLAMIIYGLIGKRAG